MKVRKRGRGEECPGEQRAKRLDVTETHRPALAAGVTGEYLKSCVPFAFNFAEKLFCYMVEKSKNKAVPLVVRLESYQISGAEMRERYLFDVCC